MQNIVDEFYKDDRLVIKLSGSLSLYKIEFYSDEILKLELKNIKQIEIDIDSLTYLDTAGAIFINKLVKEFSYKNISAIINVTNSSFIKTLELVDIKKQNETFTFKKENFFLKIGKLFFNWYKGFLSFLCFLGNLFATKLHYLKSLKNIRYKEILFEINESGIKALYIIALTSFLIGLVVAYQSAYQLKMYGANIFVVDMLGISMFRELAPLITAIVIAGRSGSAFTAQIGAMKITEELDAMKTMGFDPYIFLVLPRIIALMIVLPILIFFADMMGLLGGMLVAHLDLGIIPELFLDRLNSVVDIKHFFIGLFKGPFFAFLIASIGIYRGLIVKNDTQSIGFNTTKSVVESIFAVIICDALFSIMFTNLGI